MYDFNSDDEGSGDIQFSPTIKKKQKTYSAPISAFSANKRKRKLFNQFSNGKKSYSTPVSSLNPEAPNQSIQKRKRRNDKVSSMFSLQLKGESNSHLDDIFYCLDGIMRGVNVRGVTKGSLRLLELCMTPNVQFQLRTHGLTGKLLGSIFHLQKKHESLSTFSSLCLTTTLGVLSLSNLSIPSEWEMDVIIGLCEGVIDREEEEEDGLKKGRQISSFHTK